MTSVIVLSSSPLRTFARSPTRVEFSSPRKPSQKNENCAPVDENVYFRASDQPRDGFSSSFKTAKEVLHARSTAENLPLGTSDPARFKSASTRKSETEHGSKVVSAGHGKTGPSVQLPYGVKDNTSYSAVSEEPTSRTVVQILPGDSNKKKRIAHTESLNLQRAATRRKQWTPLKSYSHDIAPEHAIPSFGLDLTASFGHARTSIEPQRTFSTDELLPAKRRKLDVPIQPRAESSKQSAVKGLGKKSTSRSKSPVKKSLTITGLATSHYAESFKEDMTPIMQYLVSTQAMMDADVDPDTFETNVKKSSKTRKTKVKSRLKSPETVMRSVDNQEIIFATASQLAREDSPTLLRDTVEAIKQSQEHYYSSPMRSQQTAVYSIQSITPQKTGLLRFRGRKSLWSAGDRDEHDALLHIENDEEDPPSKEAFAGADALVETVKPVIDSEKKDSSMNLLVALQPDTSLFDIDDLPDSPPSPSHSDIPLQQRRNYSSAAKSPSSKRTTERMQDAGSKETARDEAPPESVSGDQKTRNLPSKPNYATWGDDELKEACQIHGLKRLRARKSMIDKLDERWAEHHGVDPKIVKAATKKASTTTRTLQPGDFLGKIHGLAARPTPKVKQPPKKKAGKTDSQVLPKQSSPALSQDAVQLLVDDMIVPDDIARLTAFDRIADIQVFPDETGTESIAEQLEPSTAPTRGTGVKAAARKGRKSKTKVMTTDQTERPPTPPSTIPIPTHFSSPGFEDSGTSKKRLAKGAPLTPVPTQDEANIADPYLDGSLKNQIRKALFGIAGDPVARSHYEQPTYCEKILLYDPIVLEDFTAWLNTEGFNAIGEDREIDANEVRDWCHENSICCLWKGGWRGNKKKGKVED